MVMSSLEQKFAEATWVAHTLFNRGKVSGSSANMSFLHQDRLYISGSGTCFGSLRSEDFSIVNLQGDHIGGLKPSKELPLHLTLYAKSSDVQAVIHTHSFYATLWSCLEHQNVKDVIPSHTPYLKMKLGTVGLVPFAQPGSQQLFDFFTQRVNDSDGYLLQNHGPIVGGKDLLDAFYILEELEESARIAWELKNYRSK
ncbi:class II aldolase/adducin family protein [Peptococcaceae bacterium 1198_IL3148]